MSCAIVLFSGGLDSIIATRLLQAQGIRVVGLNIVTPFHDVSEVAQKWANELQIELIIERLGDEYLSLIAAPQWGYGKGMNPCIDCRVAMCRVAGRVMHECGGDFVATGEVTGQRPNSQKRHQLDLIERESQLNGRLLRPLSAKTLEPTQPEIAGLVNRHKLFAFTGRSRRALMRLARELGIQHFPQPSVGCLLCEKSYAPKLRDYFKHAKNPNVWEIDLLNSGRHLRIDETLKCTIARNQTHCENMEKLIVRADRRRAFFMIPENFFGPAAMLTGAAIENFDRADTARETELVQLLGTLILRFTASEKYAAKYTGENATACFIFDDETKIVRIIPDESAQNYRVIG